MSREHEDLATIAAVRDAFVTADARGDAEAIDLLLADDVVILHPQCGVIEGRDAARAFMAGVYADVLGEFDKQASYSTIEIKVSGDLAFERGELVQELTPKAGGPVARDAGMYLWIFTRAAGSSWRIARIAGTFTQSDEPAQC